MIIHSSSTIRVLELILVLLILVVLQQEVQSQTSNAAAEGWELLWSDEFDSNNNGDDNGNGNGSGNDSVHHQINGNHPNWNVRSGFLGLNGEFQTYTTSPSNVEIRNGKLHLTAVRDMSQQVGYSSGRVNTRNKMHFKYGMVEASIKIPDMSLGLWPALWTLGENYDQVGWPKAGELDIMEIGDKRGFAENNKLNHRVLSAVHWEAFGHYTVEDGYLDMPDNLSQDFHTYKMIWQPDHVEMFVDNFSIHRVRLQDCDTLWDCTELHQPHYLILNLAVAGLFTCCEHGFALNDYPEGTSWTMQVDYVRLYGNEHTEVFFPTSSSDNDSEEEDSDWEGAAVRKRRDSKMQHSTPTTTGSPTTTTNGHDGEGSATTRRTTRLRPTEWACETCTFLNSMRRKKCEACQTPKNGVIPDFEESVQF